MGQTWRRIERRDASGAVVDWVEVGRCARCGRGVDREFPGEYRAIGGVLYCRECAGRVPTGAPASRVSAAGLPPAGIRRYELEPAPGAE